MTKNQIEKFQQIYHQESGKWLTYEEAHENAIKLIEMIRHIYKPIKKEDLNKFLTQQKI